MIETVRFGENGHVFLIDQRKLPVEEVIIECRNYVEVADAIRNMTVRGAPAIGVAAAGGIALGADGIETTDVEKFGEEFRKILDAMAKTRPTAVNLFWAIERMKKAAAETMGAGVGEVKQRLFQEARKLLEEDIAVNREIGRNGQALLSDGDTVLTHCNAGALATAGSYGTALGVVKVAHERGKKLKVLSCETRPFLQGARLTAWEMLKEGIDVTLITDNMAGHFMRKGMVDCVIVGADRVARNGDAANKIGTYSLAVLANHHNIPFFVAAPISTIDFNMPDGDGIPIEERNSREISHIGEKQLAPEGVNILNPAFDVTPARYINAIITEKGIAEKPFEESLKKLAAS